LVKLNKIYTRTGDAGETGLVDGSRASKADPRFAAIGDVDEANCAIGAALPAVESGEARAMLARIQNELFDLGADLSVPTEVEGRLRIAQEQVDALEAACDRWNERLPELTSFVLPGGSELAGRLHVARSVCRRAEREALAAAQEVPLSPLALVYLNRLSDLLFILARAANAGGDEPLWKPGASRSG
jgi:cob(I)alamin adenosyltransferase